ncbi:AP2/B3-like transcriptional factor family protein, partial [Striga asiatica]
DTYKVLRACTIYNSNEELYVELYVELLSSPTLFGEILSFDFAEERFCPDLIPKPKSDKFPNATVSNGTAYLVEYDSSLAAVFFEYGFGNMVEAEAKGRLHGRKRRLMEKKEMGGVFGVLHWKRHGHFMMDSLFSRFGYGKSAFGPTYPLTQSPSYSYSYSYLWLYDVETRELENLGIRDDCSSLTVFPYV